MSLRNIGTRTVLDDNTFNEGVKVRHVGWSLFWGLFLLAFVGILGGFLIQGTDFFLYSMFAPRMEGVRRQVFEQSKAYNQGMAMQVQNYKMSYETATDEQRVGLRSSILHQTADWDLDMIREKRPDLAGWLSQLRNQQQ